jgi:hypothetical protein
MEDTNNTGDVFWGLGAITLGEALLDLFHSCFSNFFTLISSPIASIPLHSIGTSLGNFTTAPKVNDYIIRVKPYPL